MPKNYGEYRPFTISNKIFNLDSDTYSRINIHINSITNSLFLSLSRGNRIPAIFEDTFIWETDIFSSSLMTSDIQYEDSTTIDFVKIQIPSEISRITYVHPLIFTQSNCVNIFVYLDYFSFGLEDSYYILKLKKIEAGTFVNVLKEDLDFCNFSFSTTFIYQSILEYTDSEFSYVGIPFLENTSVTVGSNKISLVGDSFYYINEEKVSCFSKGQLVVESPSGVLTHGQKMQQFSDSIDINADNLSSGTIYKVYYSLESIYGTKTGFDVFVGEYLTLGNIIEIPQIERPILIYE